MRALDFRYKLLGAGLVTLALLPVFAGFAGLGWELAQMAGLLATLGCAALCGLPLRPRDLDPPTLLSLKVHTLVGWALLIAVSMHIVGLVLADRTVIEYLKPTMPLYLVAGLGATVLLFWVVLTAAPSVRRRFFRRYRGFQAMHVVQSCLALGLIAVHVATTARYAGGAGRRIVLLAVTIGAMFMLLRRGRPAERADLQARGAKSVFGQHRMLVSATIGVIAAALLVVLAAAARAALRESAVKRVERLALDFPHGKHATINCLECHHNYADGRGLDACVDCHRSSRTDLKEGAEARFHGFCLDCHRHPDTRFARQGPVSGCRACHHLEDSALDR